MQSFTVVEDFQPLKQAIVAIELILPSGMVDQFGSEQMEEQLSDGMVPAVAFATHALHQAVSPEQGPEGPGGILDPPVRMDDQLPRRPSTGQSLLQGLEHQFLSQRGAHHPARIQVNNDRQAELALPGAQVADVPHPHLVGTRDGEATLQQIGGDRLPMPAVGGGDQQTSADDRAQFPLPHHFRHLPLGDPADFAGRSAMRHL